MNVRFGRVSFGIEDLRGSACLARLSFAYYVPRGVATAGV